MSSIKSAAEIWWNRLENGAPPFDLQTFIATYSPLSVEEACEVLLVDQQYHWQRAPGPSIEEYLAIYPAIAANPSCLVDLIYGEIHAKGKLRIPIVKQDYFQQFPSSRNALEKHFDLMDCLSESVPSTPDVLPGPQIYDSSQRINIPFQDYELLEMLGCSAMGLVFKARHLPTQYEVALKMPTSDRLLSPHELHRFRQEVLILSKFNHPSVISLLASGECDGVPFYTMPYVQPGTLATQWKRFDNNPSAIAKLMHQIATAVDYIHSHRIAHRDINPENILVDVNGRPLVTDFGLAVSIGTERDIETVGTPIWMAPEIANRKVRQATVAGDIYGIGAVFYFVLTGRAPYLAMQLDKLLNQIGQGNFDLPSRINQHLCPDLEAICLKAMSQDPLHRYVSAQAFADDVASYLSQHNSG